MTTIIPGGTPAVVFNREGTRIVSLTAAVATDPPAPIVRHSSVTIALVTASSNTDHIILPADAEVGDVVEVYVSSGGIGAIKLVPDSGSQVNDGGTDVPVNCSSAVLRKATPTKWWFT